MPARDGEAARKPSSHARFEFLDGLRGLAALAVVAGHTSKLTYGHIYNGGMAAAVPFFFMLSGFVLNFAYPSFEGRSIRDYAIQRAIRLYPLIVLSAVIGCAVLVWRLLHGDLGSTRPIDFAFGVASAFTALPSPSLAIDGWRWPANYPEWSLFFELVASVALALVLTRLTLRGLIGVALASWVVLLLFLIRDHSVEGFGPASALTAFSFTLGCILIRSRPRIRGMRVSGLLIVGFVVLLLFAPGQNNWIVDFAILSTLLPAAILFGSNVQMSSSWQTVARWLGEISYPIYILHAPVSAAFGLIVGFAPQPGYFVGLMLLNLAVSCAALYLYDIPLRRYLRRQSGRRTP